MQICLRCARLRGASEPLRCSYEKNAIKGNDSGSLGEPTACTPCERQPATIDETAAVATASSSRPSPTCSKNVCGAEAPSWTCILGPLQKTGGKDSRSSHTKVVSSTAGAAPTPADGRCAQARQLHRNATGSTAFDRGNDGRENKAVSGSATGGIHAFLHLNARTR